MLVRSGRQLIPRSGSRYQAKILASEAEMLSELLRLRAELLDILRSPDADQSPHAVAAAATGNHQRSGQSCASARLHASCVIAVALLEYLPKPLGPPSKQTAPACITSAGVVTTWRR
jgi:hypothetical protein